MEGGEGLLGHHSRTRGSMVLCISVAKEEQTNLGNLKEPRKLKRKYFLKLVLQMDLEGERKNFGARGKRGPKRLFIL